MNSSQMEGDIDMDTTHPQKSNVMVECNRERENIGSSKRFQGSEEMNEKNLTYVDILHVEEVEKDHCNWDNLWVIANTLLFDIMEDNEYKAKECTFLHCSNGGQYSSIYTMSDCLSDLELHFSNLASLITVLFDTKPMGVCTIYTG